MTNKSRWAVIAVDGIICIANGIIGAFGLMHNVGWFPINIFVSGMFFSACIYEVVLIIMEKQRQKILELQKNANS